MSQIQSSLTSADEHYASSFSFDGGHLALPPAKKYLVLTCMDARIDPARAFGIGLGDAHVIQDRGRERQGRHQEHRRLRAVAWHEGDCCGMLTFSNEDARGLVEKNLGKAATQELADLDFLPFQELDAAIKEDVTYLKQSKLVPDDVVISGWIYEVETGKINLGLNVHNGFPSYNPKETYWG
ncbi:hypothetical protein MBLNU459_g1910t1 [Dothideomycetes sp. NU459]